MIRFGFDNEGFVHIQSWLNGNLLSFENRPWMRPPGMVTLRLNVRGDGAMGYINGHPAFTTPLVISSDVAYGWWSIAPFSPELGLARARAWNELPGWRDGPVLMLLTLGLYHLALGLRTRTWRWVFLGGALLTLAVLIPGVAGLRSRIYLATALLAGATLIAAGLIGRMRYERELSAGQVPRAVAGGSD